MERYREVFEDCSVTRIVVDLKDLPRFSTKNRDGVFHVYSRTGEIVEVRGLDCLCGRQTIKNKDVPEIIQTFRNSYPNEKIYLLIWVIGTEDMSEIGFLSSADEITFNPKEFIGHVGSGRNSDDYESKSMNLDVVDKINSDLDSSIYALEKPKYCTHCLKIVKENQISNHCEKCGLLAHDCCMTGEENRICISCSNLKPYENIMENTEENEDFNKMFAKLRTTCMELVMDSPIITEQEREALVVTIKRAKELSDLNIVASRFSFTSIHTVPELSRMRLDSQQLKDILKKEINNYGQNVKRSLMIGEKLPDPPSGIIEFVLKHQNIDKNTIVEFFMSILSSEWISTIAKTSVEASAKAFSKRYKTIKDSSVEKVTRVHTEQERVDFVRSI